MATPLWLSFLLAIPFLPSHAQTSFPVPAPTPGAFAPAGDMLVSSMMLFLLDETTVINIDKVEANPTQINGHPAWMSAFDPTTGEVQPIDSITNQFCAAGSHMPNASLVTLGGNGAVGPGSAIGSNNNGYVGFSDATFMDWDGTTMIRRMDQCQFDQLSQCPFVDNSTSPSMLLQQSRWYAGLEPLGTGELLIWAGFSAGGYICGNLPRNPYPDPNNPLTSSGSACAISYEYYPSRGPPQQSQFAIETGALQSYPHMYTLASGKVLLQANYSAILFDPDTGVETPLPNSPYNMVWVYPASGAVAMLPLTPANNYTQTIIFCGGQNLTDPDWGNFTCPGVDTTLVPASRECYTITPEPSDGSAPQYTPVDEMPEGRTLGQFIHLPDGKIIIVNGGRNGTAGYSSVIPGISKMRFGESLSAGPVLTPVIYDPNAPAGQQFNRTGLQAAQYPRLYHSSAILLPDASVLVGGSNPNIAANYTNLVPFPTTTQAERFFPWYFGAPTRPTYSGLPSTLTYGGSYFNLTVPSDAYNGIADNANSAADNTVVRLMRPGFSTHAMNMGQRSLELNMTSTVNSDGSLILHVSQPPPNPNLFQPGPGLLFVVINGIPSNGSFITVGTGNIEQQPTYAVQSLPSSVRLSNISSGSGTTNSNNNDTSTSSKTSTGAIVGGIVGAIAVVGILGAVLGIYLARRRRATVQAKARAQMQGGMDMAPMRNRDSDGTAFMPLRGNDSMAWNASMQSLHAGMTPATPVSYQDKDSGRAPSHEYDPYYDQAHTGYSSPSQLQQQFQQRRY